MNLEVLNETYSIINLIKESEVYENYILNKNIIENDDEIIKIIINRDKKVEELIDLKRFDKENIKKEIEIKKEIKSYEDILFLNSKIKEYKMNENELNEIIDLINNSLFSCF